MGVLLLLGAGAGLCWGVADFFGGVQSRRLPTLAVAFWSQLAGGLALLAVLVTVGGAPVGEAITWGAIGGIFAGLGVACFYRGLAVGPMSIVAPVAACGAVVPVLVGLAGGEVPGALAGLGIVAAIAGVVLVSLQGNASEKGTLRTGLPLALGAALGFGLFFVFLDHASAVATGSPLWAVAGARLGSLPLLGLLILLGPRALPWPGRRIGPVASVGVLDTTANVLFAFASTLGSLGIVATLGALYPVATVLLGRFILGEHLGRAQATGVVLALAGVVLLSLP